MGPVPAFAAASFLLLLATYRTVGYSLPAFILMLRDCGVVTLCAAAPPLATMLFFGFDTHEIVTPLAVAVPGAMLGFLAGVYSQAHPIGDEVLKLAHAGHRKLRRIK